MKTEQIIYNQSQGWVDKNELNLNNKAQLVFLFGNKDMLKEQQRNKDNEKKSNQIDPTQDERRKKSKNQELQKMHPSENIEL